MNKQYDPRCRHSDSWYLSVLEGLLSGLSDGLNDKGIALAMNAKGMLSATGNSWTTTSVSMALWKLRHSREKSSHLHNAMLQLTFDGLLTRAQVLPLLQARNQPQVRM